MVMEKFAMGVIIGGICGALLTANNYKMRALVRKAQEEVQIKLNMLMDEKLEAVEEGAEKLKEKLQNETEQKPGDEKKSKRKN